MAIHKQSKKEKFKPACQRMFNTITAQNFEIVSDERFEEILKESPDKCCKKCSTLKTK